MTLATALRIGHPISPAAWLAARGLAGSTAGGDFRARRYWLPALAAGQARWASEAEFFGQFTAGAGRAYMDAAGILRADLAANQPRFTYVGGVRRLVIEGQIANKVTTPKHNPTTIAGWTTNGVASLSVVDDTAALGAAGLSAICTTGAVYRIDNAAGGGADYVQLPGGASAVAAHALDAYVRVVAGSGASMSFSTSGAGSINLPAAGTGYVRVSNTGTPTAVGQRLQFYVPAGAVIHIILPGLYDRAAPPPPYPIIGDTAAAVTQAGESFRLPAAIEVMMGGAGGRTALVRCSLFSTAAAMALFSFGSGTEADRWQAYVGGSPARTFLSVMTGNASIASISTAGGTIIPGEAFGAAAAIAAADYAVDDSKGALAASTAAGALPAVTRGYVGRRQDGGATGHGLYDLVALWPSRLPDARVQALAVAY